MTQVNMHEAKTNLSKLVNGAVNGEPFVIAKAGKPMVWVTAYTGAQEPKIDIKKGAGFMKGLGNISDDFNRMMENEIIDMFEGS